MVKLPLPMTWGDDHSLKYLELREVTTIVFPMKLIANRREPCIRTGFAGMIVFFVDDVLRFGFDANFGSKIHSWLNKVVTTKITGKIDVKRGGQLKFVGRVIPRFQSDPKLIISVDPEFLATHMTARA